MELKVSDTFNKTSLVYHSDKYRQIVSMGGSRSSKSYSILQMLMLEMIAKKNLKITVWRDTKVTCRATVLEDFKKIIMFNESIYAKFKENKQSGTFTYLPTGSRIIFEGADNIGKVLGSAQDISFFNEVTEFSKSVYLQITQRTAGKVICDYNPSKDFWLEKYREDPNTVFIHSTFKDNAFCPENIVTQLLSYEPWVPGSYDIIDGAVYYRGAAISPSNQPPPNVDNIKRGTADTYMWLVYGLGIGSEKPNRVHRGWQQISLEKYNSLDFNKYYGIDFGQASPTAVMEAKYGGNGDFYIRLAGYKPLGNLEQSLVTFIRSIKEINKGQSILVCDSAKGEYLDILRREGYMAIGAIKGAGSVLSGISIVQSFKIYFVYDKDLVREYNNYSWQVDRHEKPTDQVIKLDDHAMDALRYLVNYLYKYLNLEI